MYEDAEKIYVLVNKTPHAICIANEAGEVVRTIEPELPAARVAVTQEKRGEIDGVPVSITRYGKVENLPEERPGVIYIVSQVVMQAADDRGDLIRPDTGPTAVRDAEGRIVAVRSLTV